MEFVEGHKGQYGIEPVCRELQIAPSTYFSQAKKRNNPEKLAPRARRDKGLMEHILRVFEENYGVYGVRKVWRQLLREGITVARCTVGRLMRRLGLEGVRRGKRFKTTVPDMNQKPPEDLVMRNFTAKRPNELWVADFTYVPTWRGFVYTSFIIDAYSRKIVGWRVSDSLKTDLALDALEQALHEREKTGPLIHHNDRGVQYLSITYSERLSAAGISPSVGSKGDSYDNALAETINGLYKTELIRRQGPWRNLEMVEFATLKWVDWFNNRRLLEPIGNLPPSEYERAYFDTLENPAKVAGLNQTCLH